MQKKKDNQTQWGSVFYFEKLFNENKDSSSTSYFDYDKNGYQKHRHYRIIRFISLNPSLFRQILNLVDIGCANGYLTYKINQVLRPHKTLGIDFSHVLLKEATKKYSDINFMQGDLSNLSILDESVDVVTLIEVLYYIKKDLRSKAIMECVRLLKPGGILVLAANVTGHPYLNQEEIVQLLKNHGLQIEKIYKEKYWLSMFYQKVLLKINRFCKKFSKMDGIENASMMSSEKGKIFQNSVSIFMSKLMVIVTDYLIQPRLLFDFLSFLNRIIPNMRASHLIIFARRDS